MKMLLSTTALVVALGFPAMSLAQSTEPAANPETQQQGAEMSGFLDMRDQSDVFASELIGHDVYARRVDGEGTATDDQDAMNDDGTHEMAMMNRSDLDNMDNIGQINEIVLSSDGQVRALVIGVGGFLGVAEQDVAVTMDQITFASDADDQSQMYIVVNTGADLLADAPAYERMSDMTGAEEGDDMEGDVAEADVMEGEDQARTERSAFTAPEMEREGYNRVEVTEVSTELLMDKNVYDVNDNDVGTVTDMIVDDSGAITNVIIDFGGFLGIGSSQASLSFDELTILSDEGYEDVRIYVDATKEQIQELPEYESASN